MFRDAPRRGRAIAAPASSGTCEPPGASRKTNSPCSDEKRRRSAWTSSSVALMDRDYLGATGVRVSRVVLGCGNFGGVGSAPAFFGKGESREDAFRSEEHTSELQSHSDLVCRLLLEKKNKKLIIVR